MDALAVARFHISIYRERGESSCQAKITYFFTYNRYIAGNFHLRVCVSISFRNERTDPFEKMLRSVMAWKTLSQQFTTENLYFTKGYSRRPRKLFKRFLSFFFSFSFFLFSNSFFFLSLPHRFFASIVSFALVSLSYFLTTSMYAHSFYIFRPFCNDSGARSGGGDSRAVIPSSKWKG